MNVNIKSYVKRLGRVHLLDTVVEAVANSLHAGAHSIKISVDYTDMLDNEKWINGLSICDDGEGFHNENQDSFNEFMSDYKLALGCRGVGRFAFLKVFSIVEYVSIYKDSGIFYTVKFNFSEKFSKDAFVKSESLPSNTGTVVSFSMVNEKYKDKSCRAFNVGQVKEYIIHKLIAELSLIDSFCIDIRGSDGTRAAIDGNDIPKLSAHEFIIKQKDTDNMLNGSSLEKKFTLKYSFCDNGDVKSYFCVDNRTVQETGLSIRLCDGTGGLFLLSSDYISRYVDDMRTKVAIPKDAAITMANIKECASEQLTSIITARFPEIHDKNIKTVDDVSKKYPYLKRHLGKSTSIGVYDKKELVRSAFESQRKAKDAVINELDQLTTSYNKLLAEHSVSEVFIDKFVSHIAHTNEINKENLVEFVWYSDTIIDFLLNLIENNFADEATIHNIIVKMKNDYYTSQDVVQTELNNMWIFGPQFMCYDYIANDKMIKSILASLDTDMLESLDFSEKKPDIFMAMPSSDTRKASDIIIFELKKSSSKFFEKTKGIQQIVAYASALLENLKTISIVWGYLVVDVDETLEKHLKTDGYHYSYSEHGKVMVRYYETLNLLLTVVDYKALLFLAKSRNNIFTDILTKQV